MISWTIFNAADSYSSKQPMISFKGRVEEVAESQVPFL
ncbi:hypothetical protein T08_1952 [Trichinella sp. T8]|nr:hypothetical protein T08_1952 [Trichinella sp. T8]